MAHGRKTSRLVPIKAKMAAQHWNKPQRKAENPYGISTAIMRQLASENLKTPDEYNKRLQELLRKDESNGS